MTSCFRRICEELPGFRNQKQQGALRLDLVIDWLRTLDTNWLVAIDKTSNLTPGKRLLEAFKSFSNGSFCVTSTHKATANILDVKQVLVGPLNLTAARSLLLWRAVGVDRSVNREDHKAAGQAVRALHSFPLSLELAGILIREDIVPLRSFVQDFERNYIRLAQFQVDPGMWLWNTSNSLFAMFDTLYRSLVARNPQTAYLLSLCSVYGPWSIPISLLRGLELHDSPTIFDGVNWWSQLQALVDNDIELNLAIYEIHRFFLAKKKKDTHGSLASISLHAPLSQWRLATMGEDRAGWIIQTSYGLVRYIQTRTTREGNASEDEGNAGIGHQLSNLVDRCLNAISTHVDASDLSPPNGKFAPPFYTISSCIADLYLSLGRREMAKQLFLTAINHILSTQHVASRDMELMRLQCGFAVCCWGTGDLVSAKKALEFELGLAMAELACRHGVDFIVSWLLDISVPTSIGQDHYLWALVVGAGDERRQVGGGQMQSHPGDQGETRDWRQPWSSWFTLEHQTHDDPEKVKTLIKAIAALQIVLSLFGLIVQLADAQYYKSRDGVTPRGRLKLPGTTT